MGRGARKGRIAVWAIFVLALTTTFAARGVALTYPEHERVSRIAWQWMLRKYPEFQTFVAKAERALPGAHLCATGSTGTGDVELSGDAKCFTVADLPALAGDHARAPEDLITRWFQEGDAAGSKPFKNFWAAWVRPRECEPTKPDVDHFLTIVRNYRVPSDTSGIDQAIANADGDYVCLAGLDSSHFRLPGVSINAQITSSHENAIQYYTAYHTVALMAAHLGRSLSGKHQDRAYAIALLYESFALHFIQDSVAAGHIVTPATRFRTGSVKLTHDRANRKGIAVSLDRDVCERFLEWSEGNKAFPNIERFCEKTLAPRATRHLSARPVVRGDHAIAKQTSAEDPNDITEDLAVLASLVSLAELREALVNPELAPTPNLATGPLPPTEGFIPATEAHDHAQEVEEQAALAKASGGCWRWFHEEMQRHSTTEAALSNMQGWGQERCHYTELLSVAARSGDLFALEVVPVPAEVTKPVEVYSGFCGRLSIGSLPIIPAGAGGASLSLYVGMGICDYFPPYAGMRIAMGADVLFYYLSGGSLEKPSVTNRLVGARAWTSIGLDPEK